MTSHESSKSNPPTPNFFSPQKNERLDTQNDAMFEKRYKFKKKNNVILGINSLYLDLPFVCKLCARISPTKTYQVWQKFLTYLEDPGISARGYRYPLFLGPLFRHPTTPPSYPSNHPTVLWDLEGGHHGIT